MRKAAFHNLGCKVNAYETEAMQQQLQERGYEIVPFDDRADVYVINTCSVTNIADRKSRQMLHRARKENPQAVIVASGCYVQTAHDETGLAVDADIILGNDRKKDLADILDAYFKSMPEHPMEELLDLRQNKSYEPLSISHTQEHTRAYIKVQDGCNQFCSYCIIPYARGRVRSRRGEDVLEEVRRVTSAGIREIVLTGIHLSSYGTDTESSLIELIEQCSGIPGVERIRLGSLEPRIITEEFARRIHAVPQICPHFHLSLQSGADSVLRRMNRKYTAEEYAEKCDLLRSCFDDPALTTDVIVGFPQETEEEFLDTVDFLKRIKFYETHIFRYSMRKGTLAADMAGQIPESVKAQRSDVLIRLGQENKAAFESRRDGCLREVLFEEPETVNGRRYYTGYTKEYIRAAVYAPEGDSLRGKNVSGILRVKEALPGFMELQNFESH